MQVEKGGSSSQLTLKTPLDDSYEEEETGEMVIMIDKVRTLPTQRFKRSMNSMISMDIP